MRWVGWLLAVGLVGSAAAQELVRGAIAGKVMTLEGDPVEGAEVSARRVTTERLEGENGGRLTNDRGEFRVYGLEPGKYVLEVMPGVNSVVGEGAVRRWRYPVGASEPEVIVVESGVTATGKDFVLPVNASRGESVAGEVVSGVVEEKFGGAAVSGALVDLKSGAVWLRTRTDAAGQFRFTWTPAGQYQVVVWKAGYLKEVPERLAAQMGSRAVKVIVGKPVEDVRVSLLREGVFAGRVMAEGKPVLNAMVSANRMALSGALERVGSAFTNDLGEFRIHGLAPGKYFVVAEAAADAKPERGLVPTFFPNTTRFGEAVAVRVGMEGTPVQLDLEMATARKRMVRGVVRAPDGATSVQVRLRPVGPSLFGEMSADVNAKAGTFVVQNVWPGEYEMVGTALVAGGRWMSVVPVNLREGDEDGVQLVLMPLLRIRGLVRAEDAIYGTGGVQIRLSATGNKSLSSAHATSIPDGPFTLEDVEPGTYRLTFSGAKGACYVKNVTLGTGAVDAQAITLLDGTQRLHVTLGTDCGKVHGEVVDRDGKALSGKRVMMVGTGVDAGREELTRRGATNAQGQFIFEGIATGSYDVFELSDEMDDGEIPASGAHSVEVRAHEEPFVKLTDGESGVSR